MTKTRTLTITISAIYIKHLPNVCKWGYSQIYKRGVVFGFLIHASIHIININIVVPLCKALKSWFSPGHSYYQLFHITYVLLTNTRVTA